ncbi:MAG: hypothetical protein ACP5RF_01130 [Candidatus Micrarchaeia archaeon]
MFRSPDGRLKADFYYGNEKRTVLSERIMRGFLVTEFNEDGEVLGQSLENADDGIEALRRHTPNGAYTYNIIDKPFYEGVHINAECSKCGKRSIRRELDLIDTRLLSKVQTMPIFVCTSCGQKFYSLTDTYLKTLIRLNMELFTKEELAEREKDEGAFVNELKEYIIRIFASKKIMRISIKK